MVISDPYIFLFLVSAIAIFMFTFMLRIIEGPVSLIDKDDVDLTVFQNCVWVIVVTMTTVGYGDYYPKTNLGRLIAIASAISGTVLMSFIIVAFTNSLKFTENELRAFDQREREDLKKIIEKRVGDLFLSIHRYHMLKKKYKNAVLNGVFSGRHIENLRKNVKEALYMQIKNKRKFKDILHKFRTIYDPLTEFDSIKQKIDTLDQMTLVAIEKIPSNNQNINEINKFISKIHEMSVNEKSFLKNTDDSLSDEPNRSLTLTQENKPNSRPRRWNLKQNYNRRRTRVLNLALLGEKTLLNQSF